MPILGTRGSLSARGFGLFGKLKAITDPYFNYVTMLLHGDGTNGAQNNTFLDSSSNNFTITRNGNTTQGSFSPYGANWSNYFNGTATPLYVTTNTAIQMTGSDAFTIELWFFAPSIAAAGGYTLFYGMNSNNYVAVNATQIRWKGDSTERNFTASPTANTWNHVAIVRTGGNVTAYLNGASLGSTADSQTLFTAQANLYLGDLSVGGYAYTGYLSNFRVVKGTALYTGAFTPSTTPLTAVSGTQLLTCQGNRFVDASSNNYAFTSGGSPSVQRFSPFAPSAAYSTATIGGSGYFDGSGDYLTNASSLAISGSTDFTVEAWVYPTTSNTNDQGANVLCIGNETPGRVQFAINGTTPRIELYGGLVDISGGTAPLNTWTHVAWVRSAGVIKIYVNGVSVASFGYSLGLGNANGFLVGLRSSSTTAYFYGNISGLRFVNGTAVYTSAFTPPTAPPTAITNTSLLCNFTNGAIYDNAMMNDLETVGNAQINTTVKKYGTGSMAFDGSGDWLVGPPNPMYAFGSGDFTIEGWVNPSSVSGSQGVVGAWTVAGSEQWLLLLSGSTPQFFWRPYSDSSPLVSGGTLSTGSWVHIAVVRSGSTFTLYVNGTSVSSATSATTLTNAGNQINIGTWFNGSGGTAYNGYIDDLRITKGYARYTANFTPPTAAFPNQ